MSPPLYFSVLCPQPILYQRPVCHYQAVAAVNFQNKTHVRLHSVSSGIWKTYYFEKLLDCLQVKKVNENVIFFFFFLWPETIWPMDQYRARDQGLRTPALHFINDANAAINLWMLFSSWPLAVFRALTLTSWVRGSETKSRALALISPAGDITVWSTYIMTAKCEWHIK